MKRVILASKFGGDYDPLMNEPWVDDLSEEIGSYAKSVIAELGESRYYKSKIKEIAEDRYGYPVIVIGIYNGTRCVNEIEVGTFDGDHEEPITILDDEIKNYIKEEIQYTIGD